jgi:hypothetical protein
MFDQGVMATARGRRQLQKGVKYGRAIVAAGLLLTLISPSAVYSQVAATSDPQASAAEGNTSDVASKIAPVEVDPASSVSNGTATASDTSTTQTPEAAKAHASRRRRKAKLAPVPQPVPAAIKPELTPSPPQTDGGGGGAIAVMVLLAVIFIGVMSSRKSKSRRQSVAVPKRAPAIATAPHSWAAPTPMPPPPPTAQRFTSPKPVAVWQPPGAPTTVAGHVVPDGMIYLGKATPYQSDGSGCVVDPSLPVSAPSPGNAADKLGYWPSYANISPTCRGIYLRWLATGKCDSQTNIGYVFLYFYGLERRLLTDQPPPDEVEVLIAEVVRLRGIYSANGSFNGYSRRLIETVEMARAIADPTQAQPYTPDLSLPAGAMSLPLKIAIARKVVAGEPLGFELAAAGLMGLPWDVAPRNTIVVDRARAAFLRSLRTQFDKAFPLGFKLRNRKDSRLRLDYQPASSGLRVNLRAGATLERLPDPATLTWTKLVNLAAEVSSELEPYAKMLAYHPERADSLAALAVCPPHLVANTAVKAQAWLAGLSAPIAVTSFADLARHVIGAKDTKWTLRHHRLVAEVLANTGRGLEPDPRDGTERLEDATEVLVISDTGCIAPSSPGFGVAAAAAVLVAAVARAHGVGAESVEQAWLDRIHSRLNLTSGEMLRLSARLIWLRNSNAGLAKAKRLLSGATAEQRETVAWSAAIAAAAGGIVGKPEVATLENIYDKLEVPRRSLYTTIHSTVAASAVPAIEPVTVSTEPLPVVHSIPPPPQAAQSGLDKERLQRVLKETEQVSSVLADIFAEEDEDIPAHTAKEVDPAQPFPGLDNAHALFLKVLSTKPSWPRAAFEIAAREANLMPDGALEAINEWAFEQFDEPLIEDDDPLTLNASLLSRMTGRADAA